MISKVGERKHDMSTATMSSTPRLATASQFSLSESTACESAFAITASRPDSYAELTRHAVVFQGAPFPGGSVYPALQPVGEQSDEQ